MANSHKTSIRKQYEIHGVKNYYANMANQYSNPHEPQVQQLLKQLNLSGTVLDLACGDGSASLALNNDCTIVGCDPYLYEQYEERTGFPCYPYSFDDIFNGVLGNINFDVIVCSFAMHLCEESKLNVLLYQLSRLSNKLVIISPHKRPIISENYWAIKQKYKADKVRCKTYISKVEIDGD